MNYKKLKLIIKDIITPFDIAIITTMFLSTLLMLITPKISLIATVFCLYINIIFVISVIVFFYKKVKSHIKDVVLFSLFSGISYPVSERILTYFIDWGRYTGPPPYILSTPIYVILYWIYLIFILTYSYKKLLLVISNSFFSSVLIGVYAFIAAIIFENWGNLVGLWVNNHSNFMVGAIPLYVLLGYFFVFSLIQYLIKHPIWGGLICSPLVCSMWLAIFHLLKIASGY